jgi:very-short-patch-repair endonuclease
VYHEFSRLGIKYTPQYRLGRWPYDMGFPELRLLIEIDDPTHDTEQGQKRDFYKTKLAEEHGWTVRRLRKGPALGTRLQELLQAHRQEIGA